MLNDPSAVRTWQRLGELTGNRVYWLNGLAAAIRVQEPGLAGPITVHLERYYRDDPQALRLLSAYEVARQQIPRARMHLEQLRAIDPTNQWDQFNRATITLTETNPAAQMQAEQQILCLSTLTNMVGLLSLRVLVGRTADRKDFGIAAALADRLIAHPYSTWSDRFDHIHWQWQADAERGQRSLNELLARELTDEQLVQLARRLVNWSYYDLAERAIARCSTNRIHDLRVVAVRVEIMQRQNKWAELADYLDQPKMPAYSALLELWRARAARELKRDRRSEWYSNHAREMSRRNPALQRDLVQLLETWGWSVEATTLLWQQARENIEPVPALSRLASYYRLAGNTAQLAAVFGQWLEVEPESAHAKNNLALVNLLLKTNTAMAHRLAAEVVAINPTNNAFRSTHVFSLLQQGRIRESRAELKKITNPLSPPQALYTALTLAATGETEAARQALKQAEAARLLPEEANLYKQLHERIQ
jgi:hypothetical protein